MLKFFGTAASHGEGLPGATVTVRVRATAALASLFQDDGVTARANPFTTDGSGRFDFVAADGTYDCRVEKGSYILDVTRITLSSGVTYTAGTGISVVGSVISTTITQYTDGLALGAVTSALLDTPTIAWTWDGTDLSADIPDKGVTIDKMALQQGIPLSLFKVAPAASLLPNVGPLPVDGSMFVGSYRVNLKTGYIANLAPLGTAGSNYMRRQFVASVGTSGTILIFNASTYQLYDVALNSFSAVRNAPSHWNQLGADYNETDGHLYFCDTSRASKQASLTEFSAESRGDVFTSNCINVLVCGTTDEYLLAIENSTPAKVHRYTLASWPTLGSNVVLSGVLASGCHMCVTAAGVAIVPDTDGKMKAIVPSTMVATTITLSGVSGRITYDTWYDATHDLVFAVDADAKIWVLDGTTFEVLTAFYGPSAAAGLCYDPTNRILWATLPAGPNVYRYLI